jgi:hypothetical protein
MTTKDAVIVTGGLSHSEKCGAGYSVPASKCITGCRLRKKVGSVCSVCYAFDRGRYTFRNVKSALAKRMTAMDRDEWVDGMVHLIGDSLWFRWFDSGDLHSVKSLDKIAEVCRRTPNTRHWLPTKEWHGMEGKNKIIEKWLIKHKDFPKNLCVRRSMYFLDQPAPKDEPGQYSMVVTRREFATCMATVDGGSCESNHCRKCWNRRVRVVKYLKH